MFDDDDCVPEAFEAFQCAEKALVVALVQPDGRFVQHIQNAGQAGTDLGSQTDALAFTARKRGRSSGKRQVVQTHIIEEVQAVRNFTEDAAGDFGPLRCQGCFDA